MEPGAVTIAHDHAGMEEFLILEGDLVDSDGTIFGPGDFVSYDAGTHHNSWTETGCLIAVFEWQRPRPSHERPVGEPPREPSVDTTPPRKRRPSGIVAIEICIRRFRSAE